MKKVFAIFLLIPAVLVNSCTDSEKRQKEENEFVLMGNVKNAEGRSLTLTIPSKYPNDEIHSKVENGKYLFQGSIPNPEKAILSIAGEDDFPAYVFLSQDSIKLDLEIGQMWEQTVFVSDSLLQSELNRFYFESNKKFYQAVSTTIFGDLEKRDSMRVNIYPEIRQKTFDFYDRQFTKPEYSVVALHFLKTMLSYRGDLFFSDDLTKGEKEQLNGYFHKIDTSLKDTPDYEIVNLYLEELNDPLQKPGFIDYTLVDEKGEEVKLSEVIAENRYTVLDFWYSGCLPCRKFNQEGKDQYARLKEKGIEIIGINTDIKRSVWNKASEVDEIKWINLYSGAESTILADYRVRAYPTKIIFDSRGKRMDFEFRSVEELLDLEETAPETASL